jgi:hypothetical protein
MLQRLRESLWSFYLQVADSTLYTIGYKPLDEAGEKTAHHRPWWRWPGGASGLATAVPGGADSRPVPPAQIAVGRAGDVTPVHAQRQRNHVKLLAAITAEAAAIEGLLTTGPEQLANIAAAWRRPPGWRRAGPHLVGLPLSSRLAIGLWAAGKGMVKSAVQPGVSYAYTGPLVSRRYPALKSKLLQKIGCVRNQSRVVDNQQESIEDSSGPVDATRAAQPGSHSLLKPKLRKYSSGPGA